MRRRLRVLPVLCAIVIAGCGKSSPTSPLTAGATISGSVIGPASGPSTGGQAAPSSGMVVAVAGTSVSTTVDQNDNFTLTNVPASNVDLKFSGTGVSSQIALGAIGAGERVSVTVNREGSSISLESIRRMGGDVEQLEGRIDGLPPTTAAGTFTIAGQNVQTDANTKFFKGEASASFADLQLGMRVHVKGTPNAGGVLAAEVRIQNVNTDLSVQVEGLIANFTGVAAAFQFTVNGRLIKGDLTTVLQEGTVFAALVNGARVEVKGQLKDGFIFATKIEVEGPDTP